MKETLKELEQLILDTRKQLDSLDERITNLKWAERTISGVLAKLERIEK